MNLTDLAHLVNVRNHLRFLVETNTVVPKEQKNDLMNLTVRMDKLFLKELSDLDSNLSDLSDTKSQPKKTTRKKATKKAVAPKGDTRMLKDLVSNQKTPSKNGKQNVLQLEGDDAELAKRIEAAKKEVAVRKKTARK